MTTGIMPKIMLAQSIKAYSQLYALSFGPLSRAFSNRRVFDENALRICVDRKPKRLEMYPYF